MVAGPWPTVSVLVDPVRRALYDYVRSQGRPVTREQAADAKRISRNLAAFHLDKLVDVGLLRARFEAAPDQPRGRGRTPKVYESAGVAMTLTIPERRYQLVAEILADAVAERPDDAREAAAREATLRGQQVGRQYDRTGAADAVSLACGALAELGFEPRSEADERVTLGNCPFHAVAQRQPELVCGLNHAFVAGLVNGLGTDLEARLAPRPDGCCVEIHPPPRSRRS